MLYILDQFSNQAINILEFTYLFDHNSLIIMYKFLIINSFCIIYFSNNYYSLYLNE